jgi:hypothetical protein
MDQGDLGNRILMRQHLEQQESNPAVPYDPCSGMNESELQKYCRFLFEQIEAKDRQMDSALSDLSEIKCELKGANRTISDITSELKRLSGQVSDLRGQLDFANSEIKRLEKEKSDAEDRLSLVNGEYYGSSKSQKGIDRKRKVRGKNDGRDNFDGTSGSLQPPAGSSPAQESDADKMTASDSAEGMFDTYHCPSRRGCKYDKQTVGEPVVHNSDRSKLPEGAVVLCSKIIKIRDVVSKIVEHHFEQLKIKYSDGRIKSVYLPFDKEEGASLYDEIVPGTHITANLLSYLLFNRYQMSTPAYRETRNRLSDMNWKTCRQNLANWADKGAVELNKLIPALKRIALQEGADVNVDETWERYQTRHGRRKTYMWCLVNRKAGIVIFFYEEGADENGKIREGGRGRSVLTDFIGDSKIRSLQSDGYNVYMYLDDELVDIEHICCMAHSRAKFKYAKDQGCDKADLFLSDIGKLYRRESQYISEGLSSEEIRLRRNDAYTNEIVEEMRNELYNLLALPESEMSDLMCRALNYLRNFWKQIFNYRNNGDYTIDNLAAERAIRPLTVQRKNSLFFGSTQGALNSAIYNTFIETCKQVGIPFRDFFREFMKARKKGREDYDNLLPMTIGLIPNK